MIAPSAVSPTRISTAGFPVREEGSKVIFGLIAAWILAAYLSDIFAASVDAVSTAVISTSAFLAMRIFFTTSVCSLISNSFAIFFYLVLLFLSLPFALLTCSFFPLLLYTGSLSILFVRLLVCGDFGGLRER